MARAPRATISRTSGQGVSRLSYQRTYGLAHDRDTPRVKGGGAVKDAKASKTGGGGRTEYGKEAKKSAPGLNIAPYLPSGIEAIEDFGRGVSNRSSARLEPGEVKKLR